MSAEGAYEIYVASWIGLVSDGMGILSALLTLFVVTGIDQRQEKKAELLKGPVDPDEVTKIFDQCLEQSFMLLGKQKGLDQKLSMDETVALLGICGQEMRKEFEVAVTFLSKSPGKESVMDFYKTEGAKEADQVMAAVDTSSSTIDIGDLRGVRFTPPMWEVVKGCRLAGHFAKLDIIADYYMSRWGDSVDGTFSIDAAVNNSAPKSSGNPATGR